MRDNFRAHEKSKRETEEKSLLQKMEKTVFETSVKQWEMKPSKLKKPVMHRI